MGIIYKKAGFEDLELLVKTRTEVLKAANGLDDSVDMTEVERESRSYYEQALENGSHTAYLVFDGSVFIGAGGISYYTIMPTYHNPTGKKAYIMNMYTKPEYRRMGIASKTLDLLPESVKLKNQISSKVSLQAKNKAKSSHSKCTQKVHENWKTPAFYAIIEVDKSGIGCGKNEL